MTMSSGKETLCIQPSCPGRVTGKKSKSYALRECSIKKRKETEHRKNQPRKRGPKPRPKTAPMSKYRRKTANLRERLRMGEINTAFENLREKLPNPVQSGKAKCEKLTKINILHVAINYIRAMENLLETGDSGVRSFSEMTKNPLRDENESKLEMQRILQVLMKKAEAKAKAAAMAGSGGEAELRQNSRKRKFGTESQNGSFDGGVKEKPEVKTEFDDDDDDDVDEDDDDVDDELNEDDDDDEFDDEDGFQSFGGQAEVPDWKSLNSFQSFSAAFPQLVQQQQHQQQQHQHQQQQVSHHQPLQQLLSPLQGQTFSKPLSSTPNQKMTFPRPTSTLTTFAAASAASTLSTSHNSFSSTSSSPNSLSSPETSMIVPDLKRQPDPLFASMTFDTGHQNPDDMIKEFFTDFVDMGDTLPDIDFEEHFEMFP